MIDDQVPKPEPDISLLHLSRRVSCILCMLDSLICEMPPCEAIFDHKLPTSLTMTADFHVPLANTEYIPTMKHDVN